MYTHIYTWKCVGERLPCDNESGENLFLFHICNMKKLLSAKTVKFDGCCVFVTISAIIFIYAQINCFQKSFTLRWSLWWW